ncbi:MAG: hypothetical protein L0Y74_01685, partial [candidate division Zixibacteria bacterium]|nr:hypothetical protein [candidate division Zixibacteria bacterium]
MSRVKLWLFLCIFFLLGSSSLAATRSGESGSTCTDVEFAPTAGTDFTAPDTIYAVVIYCKQWDRQKTLPVWKKDIWDTLIQEAVPTYYNQNTNGKFKLIVKAYGQNGLIDGGPEDTLPFMSDQNVYWIKSRAGGGSVFFNNIWSKADPVIDFSQSVEPGDSVVQFVFFHIIDQWKGDPILTYWGLSALNPDAGIKVTNDVLPGGQHVYVSRGVTCCTDSTFGRGAAVDLLCHELGHNFKDFIRDSLRNNPPFPPGLNNVLLDLYGDFGFVDTLNYWGVGNFSVMGSGGFQFRPSPLDPYHRTAMRLTNLIPANSPIYNAQIPDYFRSDTVYRVNADNREYFLVSNHKAEGQQSSFWEQNFPGTGLLVWHVVDSLRCQICEFHKIVDIESPRGLFNITNPSEICSPSYNQLDFNSPNDSLGNDSLDQICFYPVSTNWPHNIGSGGFFWNNLTQKKFFDDKTNPSSRVYNYVTPKGWMQNKLSKAAIEEIVAGSGTAQADLITNAKYGDVAANTTWGPGVVGVIGDVRVKSGATLTIAAGTTVRMQSHYDNLRAGVDTSKCEIVVESGGNLAINGASGNPALFLSSRSEAQAGTEDWRGIVVRPGGMLVC